jgi:hypothetical protein
MEYNEIEQNEMKYNNVPLFGFLKNNNEWNKIE